MDASNIQPVEVEFRMTYQKPVCVRFLDDVETMNKNISKFSRMLKVQEVKRWKNSRKN